MMGKWDNTAKKLSDIENNVEYSISRLSITSTDERKYNTFISILLDLLPLLRTGIRDAEREFEEKWGVPFDEELDEDTGNPEFLKRKKWLMKKEENYQYYEDVAFPKKIEDLKIQEQRIGNISGYMVKDLASNVEIPATRETLKSAYEIKERIRKVRTNNELGKVIVMAKADAMEFGYFNPSARMSATPYMGLISGMDSESGMSFAKKISGGSDDDSGPAEDE